MSINRYSVVVGERRTATLSDDIVLIKDVGASSATPSLASETFTDGDTTPTVANRIYFKTANTSDVTITDFDDTNGDFHHIRIFINDSHTTIAHNANIDIPGDMDMKFSQGDVVEALSISGVWYLWLTRQAL